HQRGGFFAGGDVKPIYPFTGLHWEHSAREDRGHDRSVESTLRDGPTSVVLEGVAAGGAALEAERSGTRSGVHPHVCQHVASGGVRVIELELQSQCGYHAQRESLGGKYQRL